MTDLTEDTGMAGADSLPAGDGALPEGASPEAGAYRDGPQFSLFTPPDEKYEQFRLARLHLCNWGTFCGIHTVEINPTGTLITGENGAGKTTLMDGLMTLLISAGKNSYNIAAAQGDRTDRSLVSYIRGFYGRDPDGSEAATRSLRPDTTVTVLEAVIRSTVSDRVVVLLGLFYLPGTSIRLADVRKLYGVLEEEIAVRDLLDHYPQADMRRLMAFLKERRGSRIFGDSFAEYITCCRHRLRMENANAPALLSRALGLKKIDNLTNIIRNLVLEPGDVPAAAQAALQQFADLSSTHQRLVDAREQEKVLAPLTDLSASREGAEKVRDDLAQAESQIVPYTAGLGLEWCLGESARAEAAILDLEGREQSLETSRGQWQVKLDGYRLKYSSLGGEAVERARDELAKAQEGLSATSQRAERYLLLARLLGLPEKISRENFSSNRLACQRLEREAEALAEGNDTRRGEVRGEISRLTERRDEMTREIELLRQHPDSNVDPRFIRLRDQLAEELDLPAHRMVFAAELMEVKRDESHWRGAIERALGGFRQTLLVDPENCPAITGWLSTRHTGLHVRVQEVGRQREKPDSFRADGFLAKLLWKDHPFTLWLKCHLLGRDLICVDTLEALNATELSLHPSGIIHFRKGYFEKKDLTRIDDQHDWQLGFSSRERMEILLRDRDAAADRLRELEGEFQKLRQSLHEIENSRKAVEELRAVTDFAMIDQDVPRKRIRELEDHIRELSGNTELDRFRQLMDEAQAEWERIDRKLRDLEGDLTAARGRKERLDCYRETLSRETGEVDPGCGKYLADAVARLKLRAEELFGSAGRGAIRSALAALAAANEKAVRDLENRMGRILLNFKKTWPALALEWDEEDTSQENVDRYLAFLFRLRREGLPALEDDFREKLTHETSQTVAHIDTAIDHEIHGILDRIDQINQVLGRTEFDRNCYLRIVARENREPENIRNFNRDMRRVLSLVGSNDYEKRFQYLSTVMDTLRDALGSSSISGKQLLDPRLRMEFTAQKIRRDTDAVVDVLDSSSGKSGGEKESFAGAVLASSLAYVLTPEGSQAPAYCTVFLDEAFSATSERFNEQLLKIFRELKLHVNLLTPFKNIDIVRDYAESIVIVTKNEETRNSSVSYMSWEDYELRRRQALERKAAERLLALEVIQESGEEEQISGGEDPVDADLDGTEGESGDGDVAESESEAATGAVGLDEDGSGLGSGSGFRGAVTEDTVSGSLPEDLGLSTDPGM